MGGGRPKPDRYTCLNTEVPKIARSSRRSVRFVRTLGFTSSPMCLV